jgi:hypothetical protein
VVQSTLIALSPAYDGAFRPSKFDLFDEAQRGAIAEFLEAMLGVEDLDALAARDLADGWEHWRASRAGC